MALNFSCHSVGPTGAHAGPHCPLPPVLAAAGHQLLPINDVIVVKNEPADVLVHDDVGDPDVPTVSSHDVIKADLGPPPKEVPTGRTVLGMKELFSNQYCTN